MQPISSASLAPANAAPSASNVAGGSGKSPATDEQQQFSPMLHAAIESSTSKNPQVHSPRTDNSSSPEGPNQAGRTAPSNTKPASLTAPIDLPALLRANARSLHALETKSATPATNLVSDANSGGSMSSGEAQVKTSASKLQDVNHLPIATPSGIQTTIVIPDLQSNQMQSLSGLSSAKVSETPAQTNRISSAPTTESGVGMTNQKLSAQLTELRSSSTESDANAISDANLRLQKEPAGVLQASDNSVAAGIATALAPNSEQSTNSTSALTSSSPQVDTKPSGDSPSPNVQIPFVQGLSGAVASQTDLALNSDKRDQQNADGTSVSAIDPQQKSVGSESPSVVKLPTTQSDLRFAALLSSGTQHLAIPLPVADQKPAGALQKELSTPVSASSMPASAPDSSHGQESSSANAKQNGSPSTATSAVMDGTNQLSTNIHNASAPKADLVTQTIATTPDSLVATNNKPATPAASLPQSSARSLDNPQQASNATSWAGGHFVTDARLIQTPALSEMRISMRSDQLGSVEVRAHSMGDEMGAAITVEKRDAHTALAIELPALQQSLNDKHINVARVILTQGSLNSTTGDSHANPQQGERNSPTRPAAIAYLNQESSAAGAASSTHSVEAPMIFNSYGRLSVHA